MCQIIQIPHSLRIALARARTARAALRTRQAPAYVQACRGVVYDRGDVKAFSQSVLKWWATHRTIFPTWALLARIAFCLSPNSAACERVFSLLTCVFGSNRDASLADQVEASVMLRHNRNKQEV